MKKLISLTGAAVFALSTTASAATFDIIGGTVGQIPEFGETNEVLTNVFGQNDALGTYGSQIGVILDAGDTEATLDIAFMGYEAGFTNTFELTNGLDTVFFSTGAPSSQYAADAATPIASQTITVGAGLLNFQFTTSGFGGTVTPAVNGSNPANDISGESNFFTSFAQQGKDTIFLFFDDTGAGDDDNHDDFVVRLSFGPGGQTPQPVPLPAGGLLLLGGLGALAIARRRKTAA